LKKVKRRYLALEIESPETPNSNEFINAVWDAISRLYGEHGASQMGLNLINFDEKNKNAILRTGHITVDMVRTAVASITQIGDKPAAVHVLAVSGTIKALHKRVKQ
jgi:RNase P/RNase MRP subunit POP5